MATTQAVTDTAAPPKKPPSNKGGRPSKAALEAKARAKRDPVAQIEGDTSLDFPPEYRMDPAGSRNCVPKPPHFRYGTDQPSPRRPEHFFQWWSGLTPAAKEQTIAYVYRNYPVIQIKTPDPKSPTGFRLTSQIDKRSGADPIASLDDMLHHYGSGNYTIRFNQANPSKPVCLCIIQGLRDEQHPPVVDPNTLAIEDPANRPYIEGLRMRGIRIPGIDPMEETSMIDAAAVDRLAGTVERMAEQNARLASRPQMEMRREEPKQDAGIVAKAFSTSLDMMSEANKMQQRMLTEAVAKVQEVNATATNPMSMLGELAGILKTLVPTPVTQPRDRDSGPSQADMLLQAAMARADKLETRIFEMQASQLTLLQGMLAKSQEPTAAAQSRAAAPAGVPTTPYEMLKELVKLKDGLGSLTGEGEREANPAAATGGPWWASLLSNLPVLAQMGMGMMAMYSQASYNNAIAATAHAVPGTAMAVPIPPTMPAVPSAEPQPSDEIPTPPTDSPTVLPHPGDSTMAAYHSFLAQLEKPLRVSLDNNETGDTFAEKLVEFHGQTAYDVLHNLGRDRLIQILSTYPPIWQVVSAMPQKFGQFLDEFMTYGDESETPALPPKPEKARVPAAAAAAGDEAAERPDRLHAARVGAKTVAAAPTKPTKAASGPQPQ